MEQRFNVAKMLDDGKTYLDIQESTNASTATISRVGRALSEGTGVIGEVLKRQKEE
jgi:TrpR-related protein YerC/YecD